MGRPWRVQSLTVASSAPRLPTILVVDDDVLVRALLRDRLGPRAVCVSRASEAIATLGTEHVDALVIAIEGAVDMPAALLQALATRAPDALRVILTDRLDRRGAASHPLADAVWPRTMLDVERLATWLEDELRDDPVEASGRTTSLLPRPLDAP